MLGFHITVPGMNKRELIRFVKQNMPGTRELLRRAKLAKLPAICDECEETLVRVCERYEKIPTEDSGMRFPKTHEGSYQVMQLASGGHACREIRESVCRIIHRHLIRKLRLSQRTYVSCII